MSYGSTPPPGDDRPDPTSTPEERPSEGYGSPPPPPPQYGSTEPSPPAAAPPSGPAADGGYAPPPPPPPSGGYAPTASAAYGSSTSDSGYAAAPQAHNVAVPQSGGLVDVPGAGTVKIATFGQRLLARLIDSVIVGVVFGIFYAIGLGALFTGTTTDARGNPVPTTFGLGTFFLFMGVAVIFTLLYEVTMVALRGQTLGKMAMGLKIILQQSGQIPGWGPSFVRWIIPAVAGFVCGIGQILVYLSPLFDNSGRFQGWHDKAANDLVISLK